MKTLRLSLFMACFVLACVARAAQPGDPVIDAIDKAYRQAQEAIKHDSKMGNDMVTTVRYIVPEKGKTTATLRFFFKTIQTEMYMPDENVEPYYYHPLYFIERTYNVRTHKLCEQYLFDPSTEQFLFALVQDLDELGQLVERRYYYHEGDIYSKQGEPGEPNDEIIVMYQAQDLKRAFDNIIMNPKE
ncbi:MAG: hypothetical protein J6I72_08725 [Muribaculaceae bacterium]|nr:hypothetical protein [Muribaculaceae bacterium]